MRILLYRLDDELLGIVDSPEGGIPVFGGDVFNEKATMDADGKMLIFRARDGIADDLHDGKLKAEARYDVTETAADGVTAQKVTLTALVIGPV